MYEKQCIENQITKNNQEIKQLELNLNKPNIIYQDEHDYIEKHLKKFDIHQSNITKQLEANNKDKSIIQNILFDIINFYIKFYNNLKSFFSSKYDQEAFPENFKINSYLDKFDFLYESNHNLPEDSFKGNYDFDYEPKNFEAIYRRNLFYYNSYFVAYKKVLDKENSPIKELNKILNEFNSTIINIINLLNNRIVNINDTIVEDNKEIEQTINEKSNLIMGGFNFVLNEQNYNLFERYKQQLEKELNDAIKTLIGIRKSL